MFPCIFPIIKDEDEWEKDCCITCMAIKPGAKKFIQVGDKIKKGQTIMIVEAMKTMNHVPATSDGTVKDILVKDGQPVEFGQTLIILK